MFARVDSKALLAIVISEAVSCLLAYRMLRRPGGVLEKIGLTVVLLIPMLGPIFYWFLAEDVPPQHPFLQNHSRGVFTHRVISMKADEEALRERTREVEEQVREANTSRPEPPA